MERTNSRKEKEHLTRRADILKAAESLFAEKGFHGATMADLATESEFSVGTLYKFFGSKEEVYYILILERLDLFHLQLETEVNQHPAGLAQIRVLIEACLRILSGKSGVFQDFHPGKEHAGIIRGGGPGRGIEEKIFDDHWNCRTGHGESNPEG